MIDTVEIALRERLDGIFLVLAPSWTLQMGEKVEGLSEMQEIPHGVATTVADLV